MTFRKSAAFVAAIAAVSGIASAVEVWAGADVVAFPENYAKGVQWQVVDKPPLKQVHVLYATPESITAASKDQPMPNGTVFVVVRHAAKLDPQGNPLKDSDGRLVMGDILGFNIMEKRTGWGGEYPDTVRNGEWEYRAFDAQKKPDDKVKLTACFECHKPLASQDFVQAYDKLKLAESKLKRE
jgi:hypothetical protein